MFATVAPMSPGVGLPRPARPLVALIAGGYTGGHIQCALAIAAALERAVPGATCILGGAQGGPEIDAAQAAGYPIETVWIRAFDRERSVGGVVANLRFLVQLAVSRRQARKILERLAPDVVIGVGGYPSAPFVLAAQKLGIPTLLHEANVFPGLANQLLGRRARRVCLGHGSAARHFPDGRTVVTGTPVRSEIGPVPPAEARARLGLADRTTLLVTGGSLGSPILNDWMRASGPALLAAGLQVVWQCGDVFEPELRGAVPAPVAHLDDMAAAYGAADLVVTSAGALTLAELAHLGKPTVIVPLRASEDHQAANARALAQRGVPVVGREAVARDLLGVVEGLLGDEARRAAVGAAMRASAAPSAADRVAAEVMGLVAS